MTTKVNALAFQRTVAEVNLAAVPVMSRDRGIGRKEQAKLARKLFSMLGIKGVSVTAPNYSMAQSVDVNLPKREPTVDTSCMDWDDRMEAIRHDPATVANRETEAKIEAIILAAFPSHHYDYYWSVD